MKVTFTKNVKYNGKYYDKDASYDLADADVKVLKEEQGEGVFAASTPADAPVSKPVDAKEAQKAPQMPPAPNVQG
jgi:hypothetical protein